MLLYVTLYYVTFSKECIIMKLSKWFSINSFELCQNAGYVYVIMQTCVARIMINTWIV